MLLFNVMTSLQGCDGLELLDWLFDQNNGILRHEEPEQHTWPIQDPNVCETVMSSFSHFLVGVLCMLLPHT